HRLAGDPSNFLVGTLTVRRRALVRIMDSIVIDSSHRFFDKRDDNHPMAVRVNSHFTQPWGHYRALSSKNFAGAFFAQRRIPELACSAGLVERAFNLKKLF